MCVVGHFPYLVVSYLPCKFSIFSKGFHLTFTLSCVIHVHHLAQTYILLQRLLCVCVCVCADDCASFLSVEVQMEVHILLLHTSMVLVCIDKKMQSPALCACSQLALLWKVMSCPKFYSAYIFGAV